MTLGQDTLLTTDVALAAERLRRGELVAFATETVYGLGANALDPVAVARIFEAKERPLFDPLIVHLAQPSELDQLCPQVPQLASTLMQAFWPGPLTLVLPKRDVVPDVVTAGLPTVAVRVPDDELARKLIRLAGVPVAAPSANRFGRVSPTTAEHVLEQLEGRIEVVLDGGPCRVGIESTVLSLAEPGPPKLLRPGGLTIEEIEAVVGPVQMLSGHRPEETAAWKTRAGSSSDEGLSDAASRTAIDSASPRLAPGMLPQHYAPTKPLLIVEDWSQVEPDAAAGALMFTRHPSADRFGAVEVLSESRSLREAACNLFAAMRRLDAAPIERIVAERFPEEGLGRAINDRLRRASGRG